LPAVALGTVACGATKAPQSAKAHPARVRSTKPAVTASDASSCVSSKWVPTVYGTPTCPPSGHRRVHRYPELRWVIGVLQVHQALWAGAAGVYDAWTVFSFPSVAAMPRISIKPFSCRSRPRRGLGTERLDVARTLGTTNHQVVGHVRTNDAGDVLQTFFPAGFANLEPPFYWFAEQEEDRAYLPRHGQADFTVNGTITSDCPTASWGRTACPRLPS